MTSVIKRSLGVFAGLALSLMLAGNALSAPQPQAKEPTATQQSQTAAQSAPTMEQRHEQMAKEMEVDPCPMMASSGKGMQEMGGMQQMGGMQGMGMEKPKMLMRAPGSGMGMGPMECGMGMPMMHGRMMMMHMMAHNPKLAGKMLEMRADMMRAIADVLTKYGKEMESGNWPTMQGKAGAGQ